MVGQPAAVGQPAKARSRPGLSHVELIGSPCARARAFRGARMGDPLRTVVVVPCFDEAGRLVPSQFSEAVAAQPELDLVFVNDGSRDRTGALLDALCGERPDRMRVLHADRNRGKAEAVRSGVLAAIAPDVGFVGYFDADLATPLSEVPALRACFEDDAVYAVFGSRVALLGRRIERSALRHYVGRLYATAASVTLGLAVYDTQCGAKLFRNVPALRAVFAEPFAVGWTFDVEILARLQRLARTGALAPVERGVVEHPVAAWRDVAGSKVGIADGLRALGELARIGRRYRPRRAR